MKEQDMKRYMDALLQQKGVTKREVVRLGFDLGLRHLWRTRTLLRYLRRELEREAAVLAVGEEWVAFADEHPQALLGDMEWVLGAPEAG